MSYPMNCTNCGTTWNGKQFIEPCPQCRDATYYQADEENTGDMAWLLIELLENDAPLAYLMCYAVHFNIDLPLISGTEAEYKYTIIVACAKTINEMFHET